MEGEEESGGGGERGGETTTEMIFEQRPRGSHDVNSGWKVFQVEEPSCTKVLWQRQRVRTEQHLCG